MATRDPNQTDTERGTVRRQEPARTAAPSPTAPRADVTRDTTEDIPGQRTPVTEQPVRTIAGRTIETARGTPTSTVQTQPYTGDAVAPVGETAEQRMAREDEARRTGDTGAMTTANTAGLAPSAPAPAGATVTNVSAPAPAPAPATGGTTTGGTTTGGTTTGGTTTGTR